MIESTMSLTGDLKVMLAESAQDTTQHPLRSSHLKQMSRSAAHARHAVLTEWEPTLAMRLGKGCHSLLLGGPAVLCNPFKSSVSKDYKSWREKQDEDAIVLSQKVYDRAHWMNEAVRSNELAAQVLFAPGTIYEKTIHWEHNGRALRCTPDARSHRHLVDLKTTRDASPDRFKWDVARMSYHTQLALYAQAMKAASPSGTGPATDGIYIVAVESKAPFLCTVHRLTIGTIERGWKQAQKWLAEFVACEQSGKFGGYADTILDLDVPDENMELVFDETDEEEAES